ncbi:hypothetical protein Tco_0036554 [Tanacetum coccineum]
MAIKHLLVQKQTDFGKDKSNLLIVDSLLKTIRLSIHLVVYNENDQGDFWNNQQEWEVFRWRLYEACGVCILELKDGTVIHMLVERRYPLSKELLQRMLNLGLEIEEESTAALHLQMAFGKGKSNPLIVDSLLKTIRLSDHLVVYNEELAIPEQTAIGKGILNPLMAGSLPKTTKPT